MDSTMDSFFFPSSPLFAHQSAPHALVSEEQSVYGEPDLLFLQPEPTIEKHMPVQMMHHQHHHQQQMNNGMIYPPQFVAHQQPQQQQQVGAYGMPSNSRAVSEFDWNRLDASQIPQQEVIAHQPPHMQHPHTHQQHVFDAHSASSSCSETESGHSTPTFVPAESPVQMPVAAQTQQTEAPYTPVVIAPPPPATVRTPSLLEQFNCTIPEIMDTTGADRTTVKVKRERASGKRATAAAAASKKEKEKPLPVFVSTTQTTVSAHHQAPSPSAASGGYTSDSSHPSLDSHPLSVECDESVENNEPSLGDDEDTKRRKLSRKAELARLARKRKKTRLGDLEAEVARLEEELARVKRGRVERHTNLDALEPDLANAAKMEKSVGNMVAAVHTGLVARTAQQASGAAGAHRSPSLTGSDAVSRSSPTPLTPLIDEFMVAYNAQQVACAKHLEHMQAHHLKPMRTFEFLSWLMKQPHEVSTHTTRTA